MTAAGGLGAAPEQAALDQLDIGAFAGRGMASSFPNLKGVLLRMRSEILITTDVIEPLAMAFDRAARRRRGRRPRTP